MVGSALDYYQWTALLKSLSGLEAYRLAYHAGLLSAVSQPDSGYYYGPTEAPAVADKMLRSIAATPMGVNYGGDGFKNACKALGIKHTRKAILAYIAGN